MQFLLELLGSLFGKPKPPPKRTPVRAAQAQKRPAEARVVPDARQQGEPNSTPNAAPAAQDQNEPVAATSGQEAESEQRENAPVVKTISSFDDIPSFSGLVTALGGKYQITEELQAHMAAIEVASNKYTLMVAAEDWGGNQHRSLKKRIISSVGAGAIDEEYKITTPALRVLYETYADSVAAGKANANKDSSKYLGLIQKMLEAAVEQRATDVHMCARNEGTRTGYVLFRVDGIIRRWQQFPYVDMIGMAGYMYTWMAEQNSRGEASYNERSMQACAIATLINKVDYKIRYQSVKANGGFDVILRLLPINKEDKQVTLEMLGYSESQCRELDIASRKTVGAIVIAGVTGSGKSTTLKTLMTMSPRMLQHKSYSIEDPVEYRIRGVTQINVQRSSKSDGSESKSNPFTEAMRVIMRADPDTIMVGEVRDVESCSMLQTMVQSGHQVMTTVHASSSIEILDRMTSREMGMTRETMSSKNFLSALVYQRLLPVLCTKCKKPAEGVIPEDRLALVREKFGLDTSKMYAAVETENKDDPAFCPHCNGRGVRGMTVAAEIILPSQEFLKLVREGNDAEAEEYWRLTRTSAFNEPDMRGKTAFEHGMYKVSLGIVDLRHLEDNFSPMETYNIVVSKNKPVSLVA